MGQRSVGISSEVTLQTNATRGLTMPKMRKRSAMAALCCLVLMVTATWYSLQWVAAGRATQLDVRGELNNLRVTQLDVQRLLTEMRVELTNLRGTQLIVQQAMRVECLTENKCLPLCSAASTTKRKLGSSTWPPGAQDFAHWCNYLGGAEHYPLIWEIFKLWEKGLVLGLQPSSTPSVIDVGVNVGGITLFSAAQGFKVFGYEAVVNNFDVVSEIIGRSQLGAQVTDNLVIRVPYEVQLWNAFASNKDENVRMNLNNEQDPNAMNGIIEGRLEADDVATSKANTVVVRSRVIDDDFASPEQCNVLLMKVDTEGSEGYVLKGARRLISKGCVKFVLSEFVPAGIRVRSSMDPVEYLRLFLDHGYRVLLEDCDNPGDYSPRALPQVLTALDNAGIQCPPPGSGHNLLQDSDRAQASEVTLDNMHKFVAALEVGEGTLVNLLIVHIKSVV